MKEKIKKVMQTSPYNYIITFLIIFIIVFFLFCGTLIFLENSVEDRQISYTDFVVIDKYANNGSYIIVADNNVTYNVTETIKIYNTVEVGKHYYFVIKNTTNSYKIIQVYNETK